MDLNFNKFEYQYSNHRYMEHECYIPRDGQFPPYHKRDKEPGYLRFGDYDPKMTRSYPGPSVVPLSESALIPLNRHTLPTCRQQYINLAEPRHDPVQSRTHCWYHPNKHAGTHYRLKHNVKRLDKAAGHPFQNQILKSAPSRVINENFPPYPRKELQLARNTLIDELYFSRGTGRMVLFNVRKATGVVKDTSFETETKHSVSYDSQASFLLSVPLPCLPNGESISNC